MTLHRDSVDELLTSAAMSPKGRTPEYAPSAVHGITIWWQGARVAGAHDRYYVARVWATLGPDRILDELAAETLPYGTDDRDTLARAIERVTREAALEVAQRRFSRCVQATIALAVIEHESRMLRLGPQSGMLGLLGGIDYALDAGLSESEISDTIAAAILGDGLPQDLALSAPAGNAEIQMRRAREMNDRDRQAARDAMGEVIGRLGSPEQTLAQAGPIHVAMHAHTEIAERDRDAAVRAAAASGVERDRLVRITRMRPQHLSVVLAAGHEDDLRAAVEVVEQSRAELRGRVLAAVADGVTKYRIAQITGLSRTTIDAWLRDAE